MSAIPISDSTIGAPSSRANYSASNFPDIASALESRRSAIINPVSGQLFSPAGGSNTNKIRFYIPNGNFEVADMLNSYIRFRVKDTTGTSELPTVLDASGASAFFNRITIRNNGVVLEDLQWANRLGGLLTKAADPSYVDSVGRASGIYMPNVTPNADAHNKKHIAGQYEYIYDMKEICLLNHELYLPLMYMGNSGIALDIEFELEKASSCMANSTTYTLYDVQFVIELVTMRQDWVTQGWAHLAEGRNIELPLTCWETIRQVALANQTLDIVRFSNFNQSVKAIFGIFRQTSLIEVATETHEYINWQYPLLKDYQFRINVDLKPEQAIVTHDGSNQSGNNRAMIEVFKALRQYKDMSRGNCFKKWGGQTYGATPSATTFEYPDFMIGLVLDAHISSDEALISGLNLRERAAPLELTLNKTNATNEYTLFLMLHYNAKLVINRGEVATYK